LNGAGVASAIYVGEVAHRRFTPRSHFLRYRIFQLVLDLDELEGLTRTLRLFGFNGRAVFSVRDRDHGHRRGQSIRGFVQEALTEAGIELAHGRILMQTMPRVFGFVFNPITLYYCHAPDGRLAAMVYEVHNTFGQRHAYVATCGEADVGTIAQSCGKTFHVSPFMGMEMSYAFRIRPPTETVATIIRGLDLASGEAIIHASFTGVRRDLTDGQLARLLVTFPFMTLGVVAAIHLEAFKLALKGLRLRPAPPAPCAPVTVGSSTSGTV
jgi:DUF1365 family protein